MYSLFESFIPPYPQQEPSTPPNSIYAFCRHYTYGCEKYLLLMSLLTGLIALLEVSLFGFLGQLVDWLGEHSPETFFEEAKGTLFLMAGLILIALPLIVLLQNMLVHQTVLGNFPMKVRWQTHRYLLGQSMEFYQNEFAGRLATKVMQTALSVRESILKLLNVLLYVCTYFFGIVALVSILDLRLAVPFLVWLSVYLLLLKYFLPRLKQVSTKQADARSDMMGRIVDTYTNISTVKLFSHTQRESQYAKEGMDNFLQTVYPQMRLATSLTCSVWASNCLLAFSVTSLSIYLWTIGDVSTGVIAAATGLTLRIFGMSQWIMWEISALFENIGVVRDGMNTLTTPRTVQDKHNAKPIELKQQQGILFDHINFHYTKGPQLFKDFNLHIKPGEKIGLVGRSGAGKSSLVNLMLRFYDLDGGAIYIDNQNIADVSQKSLRANIGMVTQDTGLMHRSVKENLLYGKPDASDEEVIEAAKQASAHEFILGLEDNYGNVGYDAQVGERGIKLSGGQRQRVAIARVLLKNAPILVLDEATSALDSEVETAIQENLNKLMEDKSVIAIAHRLSTIAAMDRLIVLDQGQIVEQGDHKSLIKNNGLYAQLWARQSGGFIGE